MTEYKEPVFSILLQPCIFFLLTPKSSLKNMEKLNLSELNGEVFVKSNFIRYANDPSPKCCVKDGYNYDENKTFLRLVKKS